MSQTYTNLYQERCGNLIIMHIPKFDLDEIYTQIISKF
jgi:hypothetical protein